MKSKHLYFTTILVFSCYYKFTEMATQASQNVLSLFKDLNRLGKDGDYERALKVANKRNIFIFIY